MDLQVPPTNHTDEVITAIAHLDLAGGKIGRIDVPGCATRTIVDPRLPHTANATV